MAEELRFELRVSCPTTVFKTVALNHSAIPPLNFYMAPQTGFEPVTKWLTAIYSTAELLRNIYYVFFTMF